MATTVTPATLQVNISTQITLNGQTINSENILTIENVNEYDKRIMTIPTTSEVTVVSFGSNVAAGTFIRGDMKYFQVTNLDAVNYARIRAKAVNLYCFDVRVNPGASFMLSNAKESVSEVGASFVSFRDIDTISSQAYDGSVDIEYVVASI